MKLVVIGASHTGLVAAACLADLGHDVIAVVDDAGRLAALRAFELTEEEPGLASLVEVHCRRGNLVFTADMSMATPGADAAFLATECSGGDLVAISRAAEDFARAPGTCRLLAVFSPVPVGTADQIALIVYKQSRNRDVAVVSNPTFMRRGTAITDMMQADRIIIGSADPQACRLMGQIYRPLCLDNVPLVYTSRRAAELIRHASDAYLAMKQAFIQELGFLCEDHGSSLRDVARGIDLDQRIGTTLLQGGLEPEEFKTADDVLALFSAKTVGIEAPDERTLRRRH